MTGLPPIKRRLFTRRRATPTALVAFTYLVAVGAAAAVLYLKQGAI